MRQRTYLLPTLRDVPADADITSHQLMLRAGLIRQTAAGVYSYLPLGKRVLAKVENIIREEMDRAGGQEVLLPAIQPAELWEQSGRLQNYGPELMRLQDRHKRDFVLGATHEEVITTLIADNVQSYKVLPMNIYQIQTKFRDERRPRFGVLRSREFVMKDAYSFNPTKESLNESYNEMVEAYKRIFDRLHLNYRIVEADSGAIGGTGSHEFMVLSEVGEDTIAYSDESDFAVNIEIAPAPNVYEKAEETLQEKQFVSTPNIRTIEEVSNFLSVPNTSIIKSLLFIVNEKPVLILVRGDHDVNEIKVKNLFGDATVNLATPEETFEILGCETGYVGPINVPDSVTVIADHAISSVVNGVCGANELDAHYKNVNAERDFSVSRYEDVRMIQEGEPSPCGKGTIRFARGIEVGHVFKLGTEYSESLGATYLDEQGKAQTMEMGCYGIGVSRLLAAICEQHHDEQGLVWPKSVTPFDLHLLVININNDIQMQLGEQLYEMLNGTFRILYDDRKERAGVKFNDSDLIGLPIRVSVGKKAAENIVEVKVRKTGKMIEVPVSELEQTLKTLYENM